MQKISLTLNNKQLFSFLSLRHLTAFFSNNFVKLLILIALIFTASTHFIYSKDAEIIKYLFIYSITIISWFTILIKLFVDWKNTFSKSKFDLYFMGLLTFSIISVILSSDNSSSVFGLTNFYSISIASFLSISVFYYLTSTLFKYVKGLRWLFAGFVFSFLIPGIFFIKQIIEESSSFQLTDYLIYTIFTLPILISLIFVFSNKILKIISAVLMIANLFIIAYFAKDYEGAIFILGFGLISLFILFYFTFWIKNLSIIYTSLKNIILAIRNRDKSKINKQNLMAIGLIIFTALWIVIFGSYIFNFFKTNIYPFYPDQVRADFKDFNTFRLWSFGYGDMSFEASHFEFVNVVKNYGILTLLVYLGLFVHLIVRSAKFTIFFLYNSTWKNIIFSSAIFIASVSLLSAFFLTTGSPLLLLLLIFCLSVISILESLIFKSDYFAQKEIKKFNSNKLKIFSGILIVAIVSILTLSLRGLWMGYANGIFER